ncbi:MAG: hypothetical protein IJ609_05225 [Paludibacteraceae bacterium]|nr:hypothetical protein [Paludibacteraceae bacterium]
MNTTCNQQKVSAITFWSLLVALLGVLGYFMVHNAWWLGGDEAIVISHTGMGIPFLPTGFPDAISSYGRLYPFAYNLYDVLLLFGSGYFSPEAHYILQAIALAVFSVALACVGLRILKSVPAIWRYSTVFCFTVICVCRVYTEFITCYTGMWIVFMFLPIFLYCAIRFDETEHWGYGIVALLVINYICYCYENICVIPVALGACSLMFNYKHLDKNKKTFNWLLVASGLLFLGLYAILVLPQATNFYGHHSDNSLLKNALKIFIAQKIYWLALIALIYRAVLIIRKKTAYSFFDSLLLTSFAYFVGTAMLKLDFTYYYNIGSLIALTAILYYCREYMSSAWIFVLMFVLMVFYGRKMPSAIKQNQSCRIGVRDGVTWLANQSDSTSIYWFTPEYEDPMHPLVDLRSCHKYSLKTMMQWYLQDNDVEVTDCTQFDASLKGIWLFPGENDKLFPELTTPEPCQEKVFDTYEIKGYRIQ